MKICPDCKGCADGSCHGDCDRPRWCRGAYVDSRCDCCPKTVFVPIKGTRGGTRVRCILNNNHGGDCRRGHEGK